jgi:hypothetical protein
MNYNVLDILFKDKDYAYNAGAKWNPAIKKWTTDMTVKEFYNKMDRLKVNGIPDYFEVVLHESRWEYADMIGAESSIFQRFSDNSIYRQFWISGMTKTIFWKKLKELEEIDRQKSEDRFNKYMNDENIYEIGLMEETQRIDNENDDKIVADMYILINTHSQKMSNSLTC